MILSMSQVFDSNILDLVKQKGFYSYEYMRHLETFKEQLPCKKRFAVPWQVKKSVIKITNMLLKFRMHLK